MPTDGVILRQRGRGTGSLTRLLATAAALVLVTGVPGCASATGDPVRYPADGITIASGNVGGVYSDYASAYAKALRADLPKLKVKVDNTAGAEDNLKRIGDGRAQLGFATADTAYKAASPEATPTPAATPLAAGKFRAIARVYDEYIHLVVRAESPIRSAADLRGQRVSIGAAGSSTNLTATRVLLAVGLKPARGDVRPSQFGLTDSVRALKEGRVDAFFWSGGLPSPAIRDLVRKDQAKIRLVDLSAQVNPLRAEFGTFYRRAVVAASTYPGVPPTVTIGLPNYLVVAEDIDPRLAYELTKVLFRHRAEIGEKVPSGKQLDSRSAISTMPIPLHPGAERYYRDAKS